MSAPLLSALPLSDSYFALFELAPAYVIDMAQLEARYRELIRQHHPDRFTQAPDAEQRAALEMAGRINQAYQCLRSPVQRARYLLSLWTGTPMQGEAHTVQDPEFLLLQMAWRERLQDDAGDLSALARLRDDVRREQRELEQAFAVCDEAVRAYGTQSRAAREAMRVAGEQLVIAGRCVSRMRFVEKLLDDIRYAEDRLLDD